MPRKKEVKKEYEFINRDIVTGLILALTARPAPTDDELNHDPDKIAFWSSLYRITDKLKILGYSSNMPLYWLQKEFAKIYWIDPTNPNVVYPPAILDLYDALRTAAPIIATADIDDTDLMPTDRPI